MAATDRGTLVSWTVAAWLALFTLYLGYRGYVLEQRVTLLEQRILAVDTLLKTPGVEASPLLRVRRHAEPDRQPRQAQTSECNCPPGKCTFPKNLSCIKGTTVSSSSVALWRSRTAEPVRLDGRAAGDNGVDK
ncbi:hypothetical protein AAG570_006083 [Ranatra chinensis]|uniref:Uncharacterized protein n=1 Tax=Ranatra chinensis TaxID=642074 RepID=A0ABD0XXB3_9HEMI